MSRIGFGYDSHQVQAGRPLVLGGVQIEDDLGLTGHSDADAALHALTDAILGALAAGDIGEFFPDTDPELADSHSSTFVHHAMAMATDRGYRVANCDITIIAESPILAPYKQTMRENIAEMLEVDVEAVSVKAKTNEAMGFVGRREGIAAFAAVLLVEQ